MCIYCGTTKYRKIYESHFGSIPKDQDERTYEIHHLDGNHKNNLPENLKALSIKEHYDVHYSQGDWGACQRIGGKMKISPDEISRLCSLEQQKRVKNGTHPFLDKEKARERALQRVKNGTHPFLSDGEFQRSIQKKRVENGTHHWLDGTATRERNLKRVADGTNPFLDKEKARERALKQVQNGTHNFMKIADGTSVTSDKVLNGTNPFLKRTDGTSISSDKVVDGTHNMLGGKIQGKSSRTRVANGTHNLLGGEVTRKQLENGTHPSQKVWKCEHCGKEGKGSTNYLRWHREKCSHFTAHS